MRHGAHPKFNADGRRLSHSPSRCQRRGFVALRRPCNCPSIRERPPSTGQLWVCPHATTTSDGFRRRPVSVLECRQLAYTRQVLRRCSSAAVREGHRRIKRRPPPSSSVRFRRRGRPKCGGLQVNPVAAEGARHAAASDNRRGFQP